MDLKSDRYPSASALTLYATPFGNRVCVGWFLLSSGLGLGPGRTTNPETYAPRAFGHFGTLRDQGANKMRTYGAPYRKRTRLATNATYTPRVLCNPKTCPACIDGKHWKTAQQGKQSDPKQKRAGDTNTLDTLHAYPAELVNEIFQVCNRHVWHPI